MDGRFRKTFSIIVTLFLISCSYPFAAFKPDTIAPIDKSQVWDAPKKAAKKIQSVPLTLTFVDIDELIEPVGLAQLIDFALKNNPNTEYSWAQAREASANLGLSRRDFFPEVNVKGELQRTRTSHVVASNKLLSQYLTTLTPSADVSYTFLDFGARYANTEGALQSLFASSWAYNQELQTIIQFITQDYYNYLYQVSSVIAYEQNVLDAKITFIAAELKLKNGVADVSDVLQAKTQMLEYQVDLVNQAQTKQTTFIQLVTDMGLPADTEFVVAPFPNRLPGSEYLSDIDNYLEMAKDLRPEISSARAQVLSKKSYVKKALRDQWPVVKGDFNISDTDYSSRYPQTYQYTMSLSVNYPFFAGFYYRNKIRQAKAELRQVEANLKRIEEDVLKEVTTYYVEYKYALDRIYYTTQYLESAQLDFEVSLSNYRAGTGDILQVLTAQSALATARNKDIASIRDLFLSLTNLAFATGSLVNPINTDQENTPYQFENEDLK